MQTRWNTYDSNPFLSPTLGSSAKKLGLCGSTIEGYGSKMIPFLEEHTAALAMAINKSTT